jgi:AcrR family transcriptional regulator
MSSAATDTPPTRDRLLFASAELFRRQGYAATGLKQITAQAEVPFGSLYHHFPEGKEQLGEEVLRQGGAFFLALYEQIADEAKDVASGVADFFDGAATTLEATAFADACPIATVAGETASTSERLRRAGAQAFESWLRALGSRLEAEGVPAPRARELALSTVMLLEGGFLLSRSLRSTVPLRVARDTALHELRSATDPDSEVVT